MIPAVLLQVLHFIPNIITEMNMKIFWIAC
jgi:hypothetical protein